MMLEESNTNIELFQTVKAIFDQKLRVLSLNAFEIYQ